MVQKYLIALQTTSLERVGLSAMTLGNGGAEGDAQHFPGRDDVDGVNQHAHTKPKREAKLSSPMA
jgi:hypothetical protein